MNILGEDEANEMDAPFNPAESELSFIRSGARGSVHVAVPLQPGDDQVGMTWLSLGVFTSWFHSRTLRGRILTGAHSIDAFPDDKICMRCHHAMSEHSDRLFEHPFA